MTTDNIILNTLHNTGLTEELRDAEIESLARLVILREYRAGDAIVPRGENNYASALGDTLMILADGKVEVTFIAQGQSPTIQLQKTGDLAGILGFVGGEVANLGLSVVAKSDCKVLFLERSRFETLLNSQPAIVYYVMRGIARHVHGIVRHMNQRSVEMTNYLYQTQGRYLG